MAYNNPPYQDATTQNPWATSHDGPRFGNAYQDDDTPWSLSSTYQHVESNKTEVMPSPNPYQFTGTRLAHQDNHHDRYTTNAYSGSTPPQQPDNNNTSMNNTSPPAWQPSHPSPWRLLLRVILLVAAIGYIGFAAGASPKSGQSVPIANTGCFYYLYVVAAMTILYSGYHVGYYVFRRYAGLLKMARPMMILSDLVLTILWGVGIILETVTSPCPPGHYHGWCDFYNVSLFFGFVCFVGFLISVVWDIFGACAGHRRQQKNKDQS